MTSSIAADERPVARDALGEPAVAVRAGSGARLATNPPLAPTGDDDRVLDGLRLHQSQDLGAEVLPAVRPAQPAAGDRAEPQVHAFDPRASRPRSRTAAAASEGQERPRVQLERDVGLARASGVDLEVVRAQRRLHQSDEGPQDPVLVQAGDPLERGLELGADALGGGVAVPDERRVETHLEQLHERAGGGDVRDEGGLEVDLAVRRAGLAQVAAVRPQHHDLAPGRPPATTRELNPSTLRRTAPCGGERVLEPVLQRGAASTPASKRTPKS